MKIIQVITTNAVLAERDGQKVVLLGKKIGFKRKPGDTVDDSEPEKIFRESEAPPKLFLSKIYNSRFVMIKFSKTNVSAKASSLVSFFDKL